MAEKQSGPVKPPTLDMQARKPSPRTPSKAADTPKPADEPAQGATSQSETPKPETPKSSNAGPAGAAATASRPASRTSSGSAFPLIPVLAGGAVGTLVAVLIVLGLAASGLLTSLMPQHENDNVQRLTFAEEQVSEALVGMNALNGQISQLQSRLDEIASSTDENATMLTERQDRLEDALIDLPDQAVTPAELDVVREDIAQLNARITALQSGASADQAETFAGDFAAIRDEIATLASRADTLEQSLTGLGETLNATSRTQATQQSRLAELEDELAAMAAEPDLPSSDTQLLRLPLALSGLENALDNANPFADELQSLLALVPDLAISDELTSASETGLPTPGRIITEFGRAVPAIMEARPVDPDADMMEGLWARVQALLAIRPTGQTGDDPVTDLVARAEEALANRQFPAAAVALAQLPAPMQAAGGDALTHVQLMGEARALLTEARAAVLAASSDEAPAATEDAA